MGLTIEKGRTLVVVFVVFVVGFVSVMSVDHPQLVTNMVLLMLGQAFLVVNGGCVMVN